MKTNRNVSILLENGFHFSTISKMKPNEVKLLAEKFFKPMGDVEQAKKDSMKAMRAFVENNKEPLGLGNDPKDFSDEQIFDKVKALAYWAKSPNGSKLNKMAGELYRIAKPLFKGKKKESNEAIQKVVNTSYVVPKTDLSGSMPIPPGAKQITLAQSKTDPNKVEIIPTAEGEVTEKFESKAQQGLFWAKCNNSTGKTKEKWCKMAREFSDSTSKKQYKNMPEKKHPEKTVKRKTKKRTDENFERQLEEQIFNMIEKHIEPSMSKSELLKTIQEKVDKSEKFMLNNPKKNTMFQPETKESMMKKPIGKMFSMEKELGENTKEKERTREKDRTKEKDRKKDNPFRDPNPGVEEQPKAEDQKNDFMSAITSILRN